MKRNKKEGKSICISVALKKLDWKERNSFGVMQIDQGTQVISRANGARSIRGLT